MTVAQMQDIADRCLQKIALQYGSTTRRDFRVIEIVLGDLVVSGAISRDAEPPSPEAKHEFTSFGIDDPRYYAGICRVCGDIHPSGCASVTNERSESSAPTPERERRKGPPIMIDQRTDEQGAKQMRHADELEATRAANVTLNTENAQLRQALRVIRKGLSDDADGEFWPARRWLDRRDIFHGDLSGNRVLELVARHALHGDTLLRAESPAWQPIETAPKDGTTVLLFGEDAVTVGGWVSAADQGAEPGEEHLISAGWWSVDLRENAPSHWMPLPDPPVIESSPQPLSDVSGSTPSEEKADDRAALLPADPLASPPTTETLPIILDESMANQIDEVIASSVVESGWGSASGAMSIKVARERVQALIAPSK